MDESERRTLDEAGRELDAIAERLMLGHWRKQFVDTGNGIYAWKAWRVARRLGEALPDWLLEFLDECALELTAKASRGDDRTGRDAVDSEVIGTAEEQDREIAEAVGLGRDRGKAALTRHAMDRRDREIAMRVRSLMDERALLRAQAVSRVAKTVGMDRGTVGAAFDHWDPILSAPLRSGIWSPSDSQE